MAKIDREIQQQLYDPKRKMPPRAQVAFIKKQLAKKGIAPDTVDVEALVDPQLNYRENYKNIMSSLGNGKIKAAEQGIVQNPACEKAKELKQEIKEHQEKDKTLKDLKADLADAKTICSCNTCSQMGLYDPAPRKRRRLGRLGRLGSQRTLSGPQQKKLPLSRPPKSWFAAMVEGIRKRSDVRNPASIVQNIWKRLSPSKRLEIARKDVKGDKFRYDLPLPDDHPTRGTGTVRVVKPFNLAEVQVNVPRAAYDLIRRSGLFQSMRRNDGSTALVKRCKSNQGNCNIFVDRM